jgi:peptide deformylase
MIVKDINELKKPCEEIKDYEEAEKIAADLLTELAKSKKGIGLAANQIGINKRVCVINVKEPLVLINPVIIERSEETFTFPEGCLSFPNKRIKTSRNVSVSVECDNIDDTLFFTADSNNLADAMECVCVQHEIDHLDGITMYDRKIKGVTIKREGKKIGRNDKVTIEKDSESKTLKYKKAEALLEEGWALVGQ